MYKFYSAVEQTNVEWLWYPYIPYGKITLLQGDPGDGKSTCMIHLAASLSSGSTLPDGTKIDKPQSVLYQCAEDGISDTVKPRLERAGANCANIAFIDEEGVTLSLTDQRIEDAIREINAKLLILDPVQAFISQNTDMQNASKMRAVMRQLGSLAEKYKCAIVLIGHMTKAAGGKDLYRGLGSIDIAAIARSVLMVSRNKEMPSLRYLSQIKNSLAPEGDPYSFIMDPVMGFQWIGKCKPVKDNCAESEKNIKTSKYDKAKELLRMMLSAEDIPSKEIMDRFDKFSIGERTVRSACQEIGIKAYRKGNRWFWHLPEGNR